MMEGGVWNVPNDSTCRKFTELTTRSMIVRMDESYEETKEDWKAERKSCF